MAKKKQKLIVKDKRADGRALDELRPLKMKVGVINKANGSAYVEFGTTKAIAAVYGPKEIHPKHLEDSQRSVIKCKYNMVPFSVSDRKRPGYDRRSVEISKVIKEAIEPVLFLEDYPKTAIELSMEIIQADSGTRVAAITAASLALADAGIAMKDLVAAVSVGKVEGKIVIDLTGDEEATEEATDVAVAMVPRMGKITLLQIDGNISSAELKKMLELVNKACKKINDAQKKALKERYEKVI